VPSRFEYSNNFISNCALSAVALSDANIHECKMKLEMDPFEVRSHTHPSSQARRLQRKGWKAADEIGF
jgi:hypothetical protein